jgi:hypothetical protein
MSTTTLVTHCGAREVSREELNLIEAPPPTQTWYPVRHSTVVESVSDLLQAGGFQIQKATYALSRQNARMFALCQAWHKANCAECRIMRRTSEPAGKKVCFAKRGGPHYSSSFCIEDGNGLERQKPN